MRISQSGHLTMPLYGVSYDSKSQTDGLAFILMPINGSTMVKQKGLRAALMPVSLGIRVR